MTVGVGERLRRKKTEEEKNIIVNQIVRLGTGFSVGV